MTKFVTDTDAYDIIISDNELRQHVEGFVLIGVIVCDCSVQVWYCTGLVTSTVSSELSMR